MFCVIYRSSKRDQTYLYVEKKDDFSRVPEELMKGFGQPTLAMMLPLDGRKKLVNADLEKVKQAIIYKYHRRQKIYLNSIWPRRNKIHQTINVKLHPAAARPIDAVPEIDNYVRGK